MELAHGHGSTVDAIVTKRDSPLKSTNEALVVMNAIDGEFCRGIEFRMVILVNGRGSFFWQGIEDRLALINNGLDVGLGSPCKSAIRIPEEVSPKMIGFIPNSFQLIASACEFLK